MNTSATPDDAASENGINEVLNRAVEIVEVKSDLEKELRSGKKLRIKLGIDPTGPRIHIGRAVPLRKLRQFQDLGHQAVLVVGDFTALLGDASDKTAERPMLTPEQVRENVKTYEDQIGMILDLSKTEFQYNGSWLRELNFLDILQLAKNFTVQQMITRENFRQRLQDEKPIGLHELLYPLMQGYDSVAIHADVELGSTDQLFNVMAGRKLQEVYGQKPQNVLLTSMVNGLDNRKMSTSWGNTIFINEAPADQYGKVMRTADELIVPYLEACTTMPVDQIKSISADLENGNAHPMDVKKKLAWEVVRLYHGADAANYGQNEFEQISQRRELPSEIPAVVVASAELPVVDLLIHTGQAPSKSQARRLIEQGGVTINDERISDVAATYLPQDGAIVKVGKRSFIRLEVKS